MNNITRSEAINLIDNILQNMKLTDIEKSQLESVKHCIYAELNGRHEWGVPIEISQAIQTQQYNRTPIEVYNITESVKQLQFTPSLFEKEEIEEHIIKEYKDFFGDVCTDMDLEKLIKQ